MGVLWRFIKVPQHGSFIQIRRVKCNGKCPKHMADASDWPLALYHLNTHKKVKIIIRNVTRYTIHFRAVPEKKL